MLSREADVTEGVPGEGGFYGRLCTVDRLVSSSNVPVERIVILTHRHLDSALFSLDDRSADFQAFHDTVLKNPGVVQSGALRLDVQLSRQSDRSVDGLRLHTLAEVGHPGFDQHGDDLFPLLRILARVELVQGGGSGYFVSVGLHAPQV